MKGLTPVLLIALSVGIFIYYIRPQYQEVGVLRAEKVRYDEAITASEELEALRNDLVNQYNSFSTADLRRITKFLPEQIDDVRLILDIDEIAQDNNINLEEIALVEKKRDDAALRSREEDTTFLEETEAIVETLEVSFTFDATYGQFLDFLNDLETSLRIIDITKLSFDSTESPNVYTFSITLQTYWIR